MTPDPRRADTSLVYFGSWRTVLKSSPRGKSECKQPFLVGAVEGVELDEVSVLSLWVTLWPKFVSMRLCFSDLSEFKYEALPHFTLNDAGEMLRCKGGIVSKINMRGTHKLCLSTVDYAFRKDSKFTIQL